MSFDVKTEISIQASPDKVWKIFTDFDSYPKWNPFIKSIQGIVASGNKIKVSITGMNFTPIVLQYQTNKQLIWKGVLMIPGLFDGEHRFILIDLGNGTTLFKQEETFSGILVPLFKNYLNSKIKSGYEAMNTKLKELAELN